VTITAADWTAIVTLADQRLKRTNGHAYVTILKTRCQWCGRSPKDGRRCGRWLDTFVAELGRIVVTWPNEKAAAAPEDQP